MGDAIGDTAFFDRFSGWYDRFAPSIDAEELRAGLALADRDVERVLDVGGGTGRGAGAIEGTDRVVVDAAAGMVRESRRKGLEAVRGDAARLPFADESVDALLVVDAFHHFGDPDGALREAARVLRPGGVVVVRDFDPTAPVGRLIEAGERLWGFDSTFVAPERLARRMGSAGLDARFRSRGFQYTAVGRAPRES